MRRCLNRNSHAVYQGETFAVWDMHTKIIVFTRLKFNLMLNFKRSFIQAKIEFTRCFTFVFRAGVRHTFLHLVPPRGRQEPERYPLIAK